MEPDFLRGLRRRIQEGLKGFDDFSECLVVSAKPEIYLCKLRNQVSTGNVCCFLQLHKHSNDDDACLNGDLAVEHAREHNQAMFRKSPRQCPPSTTPIVCGRNLRPQSCNLLKIKLKRKVLR